MPSLHCYSHMYCIYMYYKPSDRHSAVIIALYNLIPGILLFVACCG